MRRDLEPRNAPITRKPSLMGVSTARVEGGELVIETTRIAANWTNYLALHSDQLIVVERYPRSKDTEGSLPDRDLHRSSDAEGTIVLKKVWSWAPNSKIAPYKDCPAPDRDGQQRTVMVKAKTILPPCVRIDTDYIPCGHGMAVRQHRPIVARSAATQRAEPTHKSRRGREREHPRPDDGLPTRGT